MAPRLPRLAIVSPFIDNSHGTERHIVEVIARLGEEYEVHVYSQSVKDADPSNYTLHRIPRIPGPHLVNYLWWFLANHIWRWYDRHFRRLLPDLVYSPGINCLDAKAVTVHMVFSELRERMQEDLRLVAHPVRSWPRVLHRKAYYALIAALEQRIYTDPGVTLAGVSRLVTGELQRRFGRGAEAQIIHHGIDSEIFCSTRRLGRRKAARRQFRIPETSFALLLIGNGWSRKGLPCLLEALSRLKNLPIELLVVGRDERTPYEQAARRLAVQDRIRFLDPSPDVMQFYAACDAYAGPSLYDTFALPITEAMACGLPVIASRHTVAPEVIEHGESGLILNDAHDPDELAIWICRLATDCAFRQRLGENAARTASQFTWERNSAGMKQLFIRAMASGSGV